MCPSHAGEEEVEVVSLEIECVLDDPSPTSEIDPSVLRKLRLAALERPSYATMDLSFAGPSLAAPRAVPEPRAAAWRADASPEERERLDAGDPEGALACLLEALDATTSPPLRARLLLRVAGVLEDELDDPGQALDGLLEALAGAPEDSDVAEQAERLARKLGRAEELVRAVVAALASAPVAKRIALLAHAATWLEGLLGAPDLAATYRLELAKLDASHPVVLLGEADAAMRLPGAEPRAHVVWLVRALERATSRTLRAHVLARLGDAAASADEAFARFEAALALTPEDTSLLWSFEAAARALGRFEEQKRSLETLAALTSGDERARAKTRHADVLARSEGRYADAVALYREALELAPRSAAAFEGLLFCHTKLRDPARFVAVSCTYARGLASPAERARVLARAADVLEAEGEPARAVDLLEHALAATPESAELCARAVRAAERAGDTRRAREHRARLIPLHGDADAKAREWLALAASTPPGEKRAAHLASALVASPSYTLGRSELASDPAFRAVLASKVTLRRALDAAPRDLAPRTRARLALALGKALDAEGDEAGARAAVLEAYDADPSNERAAAAALRHLVAEGRSSDTLEACERLAPLALREARFAVAGELVRVAVAAALAVGEPKRALALAALVTSEAREPHAPLAALVSLVGAPALDAEPRTFPLAFGLVARCAELSSDDRVRLAESLARRGEPDAVLRVVSGLTGTEGGDALAPRRRAALTLAGDAYEAQGNLRRALEARVALASATSCTKARFQVLVAAVRLAEEGLGDKATAARLADAACALEPDDVAQWHVAMRLHGETGDHGRLAAVLEAIATRTPRPEAKARYLSVRAGILAKHLDDPRAAAAAYEAALDADPTRLDDFAALTRVHDTTGDFRGLERAYRRMIARVKDGGDATLTAHLFERLSHVYASRLGDVDRAKRALDAARRLSPDEAGLQKRGVLLLVQRDELDRAADLLIEDLARDPLDPATSTRLAAVRERQGRLDEARTATQITACLRALTAAEAALLATSAPVPLEEIPGALSDAAWASHLGEGALEPSLVVLLRTMSAVVARGSAKRGHTRAPSLGDHELASALADASEILASPAPELTFAKGRGAPFTWDRAGALVVDTTAARFVRAELPFLLGGLVAGARPRLAEATRFPEADLRALVAEGLRIGLGHPSHLTPTDAERRALREAAEATQRAGGTLDLRGFVRAATRTCDRAGLLLVQDVRLAHKALGGLAQRPGDAPPHERRAALFLFAVSREHGELRRALGLGAHEASRPSATRPRFLSISA